MAWNDTFSNATKWASAAFLNMFVDAWNERTIPGGAITLLSAVTAGDNVQTYSLIRSFQTHTTGRTWTATKRWNGAAYVDAVYDNTINGPETWGITSVADGGAHPNLQDAVLGGHDWTRKYPREFDDATATVYSDGSAFANGHKARRRDNGRVYSRVSGAWVVQAAPAFPDTITAYGVIQIGDYIGPWIFNQLRDYINCLLWKATGFEVYTREALSVSGSGATPALGRADADAKWLAGPDAGDFSPFVSARITVVDEDGDTIIWVRRERHAPSTSTTVASTVDFYIGASAPIVSGATSSIFDAQGSDVIEDKYSLYDSQANAAAGSVTSAWTAATTQPTWATDPTVVDDRNALGWIRNTPPGATGGGGSAFAIERFTGFVYKP